MPTIRTRAGLAACALPVALILAAARPAHAGTTTFNFNSFTASAQAAGGQVFVGHTYFAQGFTFTAGSQLIATAGSSQYGDGETSFYSNSALPVTLTQDNGAVFDLASIDLGPYLGNSYGSTFSGQVLFTGTRADGSTVSATQTITGSGYQTFAFTTFTGLTSLSFTGNYNSGGSSAPQFDNVILNAAPAPEPSQVAALALGALGLSALALRARRRLAVS